MWLAIVWFVPAALSISVGMMTGVWGAGFGLAFAWVGYCVGAGSIILGQREFAVIERFGKFRTVFFKGWNIRVIGVDSFSTRGVLKTQRLRMYTNENGRTERAVMDFLGGASAPIEASVWFHIGNPENVKNEQWKELREDILKWAYAYDKPLERIDGLVDSALRPLLQAKTLEEINTSVDRAAIANKVLETVHDELRAIGVYPTPEGEFLTIEDVDLPPEVIQMRELAFRGEQEARENELRAAGYWKPIKEIQEKLGVSATEARAIFETQRGLDTLREVKPAMTLVGENLKNTIYTLNLGGNAHTQGEKP
ncbi:MAG: SPFH domain-containing protein [Candidatus Pacebacteria bacterium]|nr:SPFH domain-containing protein [Candidatus Paceibacterota bacterium]